jgi:hypothetical protein
MKEEPKQTDENGKPITYWGGLAEPKQETLEEAAERYAESKSSNFSFRNTHIRDFKEGAKWQSERMYREEETLNLWNWLNDGFIIRKSLPTKEELLGWFEQFKNK